MGKSEKVKEVSDGLFDLESAFLEVRNLAYAVRMLGSSDEMPKEPGAALDALADQIVNKMTAIIGERTRLYRLASDAAETDS
jgi:hypothetical protein